MLRTALGPSIAAWLDDPAIIEVMLNPDGRLWLDRLGDGISDTGELRRAQRELAERLPRDHLAFLHALPLQHAEGDYLFVHAGVRPGVPLDRQEVDDLLWIRDEFLDSDAEFGKIVVHGHTIAPQPDVRRNRIVVETETPWRRRFKPDAFPAARVLGEGTASIGYFPLRYRVRDLGDTAAPALCEPALIWDPASYRPEPYPLTNAEWRAYIGRLRGGPRNG